MKKIKSLLIVGMLSISMIGCGKYLDKCNPEYFMIGQIMFDYLSGYKYADLDDKVEDLILDANNGKSITVDLESHKGNTFEWVDGEIYEYATENEFKYSKDNNDDKQFSDAQCGILYSIRYRLVEEKNNFIEKYEGEMDLELYNEIIEMYDKYINTMNKIIENYDGELSETELREIKHWNSRYHDLDEYYICEK